MDDLRCSAVDCMYNDSKYCMADRIKIEHDTSCETYSREPSTDDSGCHCD